MFNQKNMFFTQTNRLCYLLIIVSLILISCKNLSEEKETVEIPDDPIKIEIDHEQLKSFYTEYSNKTTFSNLQKLALEALILGEEDINNGNLMQARERLDGVFKELPLSDSKWWGITSNSHCKGCPINIGSPSAYYGLRMIDQIITLGNPEKTGTLTMTAVIAPCAEVTRHTLPNLVPETVNLTIAPEILENDGHILKISTALFRQWVKAITEGLQLDLEIYELDECTTVSYTDNGSTIVSYPNANAMIYQVPEELAKKTDFWWVIAPSGVPGDGSGYSRHFITGGMGLYGNGLPLFLSDDAWFIRKPEHM